MRATSTRVSNGPGRPFGPAPHSHARERHGEHPSHKSHTFYPADPPRVQPTGTRFAVDLFAAGDALPVRFVRRRIRPDAIRWLGDVNQLGNDLKGRNSNNWPGRRRSRSCCRRSIWPSLLELIDFDRLTTNLNYAERGERSLRFSFPKVEGVPTELSFGKQIFALKKGRSVVPHGHNNMATAFLILKGDLRGRHWNRVKDEPGYMLIKPTIDRKFVPGECSTVSDYKDNVHWFQALSEPAFIFNLHVLDVKPAGTLPTGRVYIDPQAKRSPAA